VKKDGKAFFPVCQNMKEEKRRKREEGLRQSPLPQEEKKRKKKFQVMERERERGKKRGRVCLFLLDLGGKKEETAMRGFHFDQGEGEKGKSRRKGRRIKYFFPQRKGKKKKRKRRKKIVFPRKGRREGEIIEEKGE